MTNAINPDIFSKSLFLLLEETFETTHGIYLDKNTTLAHSLAGISAEQASSPIVAGGSTIGAQVFHLIFYLDVLALYMRGECPEKVDWPGSWHHKTFSAHEWEALKSRLDSTYHRVSEQLKSFEDWNDEKRLGGALGVIVHSAYHLGSIRQMLLVVAK